MGKITGGDVAKNREFRAFSCIFGHRCGRRGGRGGMGNFPRANRAPENVPRRLNCAG
jgi:hypothetical protein